MEVKAIDKLLDKVSKKQIVCVMGIIAIWQIEAPDLALVKFVCIALIVIYNNTCQTILDYRNNLVDIPPEDVILPVDSKE